MMISKDLLNAKSVTQQHYMEKFNRSFKVRIYVVLKNKSYKYCKNCTFDIRTLVIKKNISDEKSYIYIVI